MEEFGNRGLGYLCGIIGGFAWLGYTVATQGESDMTPMFMGMLAGRAIGESIEYHIYR